MKTLRLGLCCGLLLLLCLASGGCGRMLGGVDRELKASSANNLKELVIAMHDYHGSADKLPTDILSKDGKPLLSWRVALLPYLEQDPLFKQFKLDEPWDSPTNRALIANMPRTFLPKGAKTPEPGMTYYQVLVTKSGVTPRSIFTHSPVGRITLRQITTMDGIGNTLAVVEAAHPVIWTKPEDLTYDPNGSLPALGPFSKEWFQGAYADGTVRTFRKDGPEKLLRQVITVNGGENDDVTPLYVK
jgi:hypothetical protein